MQSRVDERRTPELHSPQDDASARFQPGPIVLQAVDGSLRLRLWRVQTTETVPLAFHAHADVLLGDSGGIDPCAAQPQGAVHLVGEGVHAVGPNPAVDAGERWRNPTVEPSRYEGCCGPSRQELDQPADVTGGDDRKL